MDNFDLKHSRKKAKLSLPPLDVALVSSTEKNNAPTIPITPHKINLNNNNQIIPQKRPSQFGFTTAVNIKAPPHKKRKITTQLADNKSVYGIPNGINPLHNLNNNPPNMMNNMSVNGTNSVYPYPHPPTQPQPHIYPIPTHQTHVPSQTRSKKRNKQTLEYYLGMAEHCMRVQQQPPPQYIHPLGNPIEHYLGMAEHCIRAQTQPTPHRQVPYTVVGSLQPSNNGNTFNKSTVTTSTSSNINSQPQRIVTIIPTIPSTSHSNEIYPDNICNESNLCQKIIKGIYSKAISIDMQDNLHPAKRFETIDKFPQPHGITPIAIFDIHQKIANNNINEKAYKSLWEAYYDFMFIWSMQIHHNTDVADTAKQFNKYVDDVFNNVLNDAQMFASIKNKANEKLQQMITVATKKHKTSDDVHINTNQATMPVLAKISKNKIVCANCKTNLTYNDDLFRCSGCKRNFYCNFQCQSKHWHIHKLICNITNINIQSVHVNKKKNDIIESTNNNNNNNKDLEDTVIVTDEIIIKKEIKPEPKEDMPILENDEIEDNDKVVDDISVLAVIEGNNNNSNVINLIQADDMCAFVKFCPKCKAQVNRTQTDINNRCSIMTCTKCSEWTYWCWHCNAVVDPKRHMRCVNCRKLKMRNCKNK